MRAWWAARGRWLSIAARSARTGCGAQDVENIAALPLEAAEAEEMLRSEGSLLAAYECLAVLEGTSMKAQRALESGTNVNLREAKNLNSYFQKVLGAAASVPLCAPVSVTVPHPGSHPSTPSLLPRAT